MNLCKVEGCEEKQKSKGYCGRHYMHIYKHGKILKGRLPQDPNEIIIKGDVAEVVLYNKKCKEIARTIIDTEDVEKIKKYKWHLAYRGYVKTNLNGTQVGIQHIVLGMQSNRKIQIDHKNRDPLFNRKTNLRACTQTENLWNSKKQKNNTSGYTGVYWHKCKRWQAMICIKNKLVHLGLFKSKIEAAKAYNKAVKKHRDKFAYLNRGVGT